MKVIGVLGGMGPQATIDLYQKILNNTPATRDQEHLQVLIWSDPTIPDRTAAILRNGEDPIPKLQQGAAKLIAGGAQCIAIPCNTAHYFLPELTTRAPEATYLNMIDLTAKAARSQFAPGSLVAITGTTATLATGLYQRAIERVDLTPLLPPQELQDEVMDVIFGPKGVKAGFVSKENCAKYAHVLNQLKRLGAACAIAGCTELPLVTDQSIVELPVIDPTTVLARAAVQFALEN